jgi:hypothetical protein
VIIQDEREWIEIPQFMDAGVFLEVSNKPSSGSIDVDFQSSPTRDEAFFGAKISGGAYVARYTINSSTTVGVQAITLVRWASVAANQPLGQFGRFKLTFNTAANSLSFRIMLLLNQAGWR